MANRLATETSPYLRQHMNNPVDWFPWGPEALELAITQKKPIMLSIGYSACHWCHVMERESFDDDSIAELLNTHFISIKVDREERPDIDDLYMTAVQAFTGGRGGWPMTVFLTPTGVPFYGGTYFPPEPRFGMPSFREVLEQARTLFTEIEAGRTDILDRMTDILASSQQLPSSDQDHNLSWLDAVYQEADQTFDNENGGFGWQPKFPPHSTLTALLAHGYQTHNSRATNMVLRTLDNMCKGGMYDIVGGGFSRYSVDNAWLIPHFEKMLYDNAQLIPLYVDAFKITKKPLYKRIVHETVSYILEQMTAPSGAFYASEDADSEGEEGRFYVWNLNQLRALFGTLEALQLSALFGVTKQGNFEQGMSALRMDRPIEDLTEDERILVVDALEVMRTARTTRIRPNRDEKIITAWNGLAISALARAGACMAESSWLASAESAAKYLLEHATVDGRLMRISDGVHAKIDGFLDDYAFFVQALLDLYESTRNHSWLKEARRYTVQMMDTFWDPSSQSFFYSSENRQGLMARSRRLLGGAEPGSTGIAALCLVRLADLTDTPALRDQARQALQPLAHWIDKAPRTLGYESIAWQWLHQAPIQIGVCASEPVRSSDPLLRQIQQQYLPFAVQAFCFPSGNSHESIPWMKQREPILDQTTVYLCKQGTCSTPTTDEASLASMLGELRSDFVAQHIKLSAPAFPASQEHWVGGNEPETLPFAHGGYTVLFFWTSCSINCIHVLPEILAIQQRYSAEEVQVIGVHSPKFLAEHKREHIESVARRLNISFPIFNDFSHALWEKYQVKGWPTVMIVDKSGDICWRQAGETHRQEILDVIDLSHSPAGHDPTPTFSPSKKTKDTPLHFPGKLHVWVPDTTRSPHAQDSRLYIANSSRNQILECQLTLNEQGWPECRRMRTFGQEEPGYINGAAEQARFRHPMGIQRIGKTLLVADSQNHAIRSIALDTGLVRTVAGTGVLGRGGPLGPTPTQTPLRSPLDITAIDGFVFIAMAGTNQVWIYSPKDQRIGPFIGSGSEALIDGPPQQSRLAQPSGLEQVGSLLVFADSESSSVRAFDFRRKLVVTVIGQGLFEFGDVDDVDPEHVRLQNPQGITGNHPWIYVADTLNHKVKRVRIPNGSTETLTASGQLQAPTGLELFGEYVLIADTGNHRICALHQHSHELREVPIQSKQSATDAGATAELNG